MSPTATDPLPPSPRPGPSAVASVPAAEPAVALAHFERLLAVETDCWDVNEGLRRQERDFVLLQVNGTDRSFAAGHLPGAVHLHHSRIDATSLARYPDGTLFVVYCAGPHCNAADRAAARLAGLGRPVKKMIGGITGWLDEGFPLVVDDQAV